MNVQLVKTLAFIALILSVIIIAEFSYANYSRSKLKRELAGIVAGHVEMESLPSINLKEKPVDHYSDLIKRPLFNHNRQPFEEIIEVSTTKPSVKKTTKFKHELIGIFGHHGQTSALFRNKKARNIKTKNDRFYTVQVGQRIEGWLIKKININNVVIESNGKLETVEWSKTKPKVFKPFKKAISKKSTAKKKVPVKDNPFMRKNKKVKKQYFGQF
ncbi:MAG: hypothetical protein Q9M50_00665 [Methylococcales bacterium]|nr:hypothetical protein [Methylococcales bacterium]